MFLDFRGRRLRQLVELADIARQHVRRYARLHEAQQRDRIHDVARDGTTTSMTSSSPSSLGTGIAAHSRTSGCALASDSTSNDEMFSPRRRIASFMRSTKKKLPSASRRKPSPVWNQPLRHTRAVAS